MTLSTQSREYMAKREILTMAESSFVDSLMWQMYDEANSLDIPAATDDRAAELEAAIIKFIIDSREE